LRERRIPFAVVGAAALAVHGVSRATRDVDVLVVDAACLSPATWATLERDGVAVTIRSGSADDPLAGVVRLTTSAEPPIDLIVGRERWQAQALDRATARTIDDLVVPVATPADLVLLKLYAGGPQDAWDILQLLEAVDRAALVAEVEAEVAALPEDSRRLWARLVESG